MLPVGVVIVSVEGEIEAVAPFYLMIFGQAMYTGQHVPLLVVQEVSHHLCCAWA